MKNFEAHRLLTDGEFKEQFQNGTFQPASFTHEAHLRLAWIYIRQYGIDKAVEQVRLHLQKFVALHGASDKYNETVTVASIMAVYHFMLRSQAQNFNDFIAENQGLKYNLKELLLTHYDTNIFADTKAKREFLEPELLPFD